MREYVSGLEYYDGDLEAIYHTDGRLTPIFDQTGNFITEFQVEYWAKDHSPSAEVRRRRMGNTRVSIPIALGE